ncbi:MAG: retropepsin-like aspartic protease family protein [Kangiellaceae bacterium]
MKIINKSFLFSFTLLFLTNIIFVKNLKADEIQLKVIALFKNAVMINYNGKQKMLRKGQSLNKNIKLLSADSHGAVFIIDGKKTEMGLHDSRVSEVPTNVNGVKDKFSISIPMNHMGMFQTSGSINGVPISFLVDTGATLVAMSEQNAKKIGLQYKLYGKKSITSTAAGNTRTWIIPLKKVSVAGLELTNVYGAVVEKMDIDQVLLGMSFLRQLKMNNDGQILKLTKKY